jgi:hypothetical protein
MHSEIIILFYPVFIMAGARPGTYLSIAYCIQSLRLLKKGLYMDTSAGLPIFLSDIFTTTRNPGGAIPPRPGSQGWA